MAGQYRPSTGIKLDRYTFQNIVIFIFVIFMIVSVLSVVRELESSQAKGMASAAAPDHHSLHGSVNR